MFKTRSLLILIISVIACYWPSISYSKNNALISIATGNISGIYFPAGSAICKLINQYKKEYNIRCIVEPTNGSIFNIQALKTKQSNLAIVQSDLEYFTQNDSHRNTTSNDNIRSLFSLHNDSFTIVVRDDSDIKTFSDIKGKRINIGNVGSGSRAIAELLIQIEGWSKNDFSGVTELKVSAQPEALCKGTIDVMIFNVGHPNGALQDAVSLCKTRILSIEGKNLENFLQKYPYYSKTIIPGKLYDNNNEDIKTFGVKTSLIALDSLDEDTAYKIVKIIFDNLDSFKSLHPVFENLEIKDMIAKDNIIPLHSGAKKYFEEKNML